MSLPFLLLATQAAKGIYGLAESYSAEEETIGEINAARHELGVTAGYVNQGAELDQRMLDLQLQQSRLAAVEKSLVSSENLRYNLSHQRALFAARGQSGGQGSARNAANQSIRAHGREETAHRLNQSYGELSIQGNKALTEINRGHRLSELNTQSRLLGTQARQVRSQGNRARFDIAGGTLLSIGSMKKSDFESRGEDVSPWTGQKLGNKKRKKESETLFSGYEDIFR